LERRNHLVNISKGGKMEEKILEISENVVVVVKAHGDLVLQGGDQPEIHILCDDMRSLRSHLEDEMLYITCMEDCIVTVPAGNPVCVEKVGGDGFIRSLHGRLEIQKVGGDLVVQQTAGTEIGSVGGDCLVDQISGKLDVQRVGGDFAGMQVQEAVVMKHIGGDVKLQAAGGAEVRAGGDIDLGLVTLNSPVALRAGGDIELHLSKDAQAELDIESGGDSIEVCIGGTESQVEKWSYCMTLGTGGPAVVLDAGGDVRVVDQEWDADGVKDQLDDAEEHWREVDEQRSSARRVPTGRWERSEQFEEIGQRAQRHAEEVAYRVERRAHEAMRRAQEHGRVHTGHNWTMPPIPPFGMPETPRAARPQGVSPQERMLILQMLAEKKITAEEAERLLQVLEGKGHE
jgi:hypothetical protein